MHTHHSCECKHEQVKFCQHCNTVYCLHCKAEWYVKCSLNHYYPWNPYYINTGFNLSGGSSTTFDNITTNLTSCTHEAING